MYPAPFCFKMMTLIDTIGHYMFLLLIGPVLKWCIEAPTLKKKDNFLHNIHPGPFDPYVELYVTSPKTPTPSLRWGAHCSRHMFHGLKASPSMIDNLALLFQQQPSWVL